MDFGASLLKSVVSGVAWRFDRNLVGRFLSCSMSVRNDRVACRRHAPAFRVSLGPGNQVARPYIPILLHRRSTISATKKEYLLYESTLSHTHTIGTARLDPSEEVNRFGFNPF